MQRDIGDKNTLGATLNPVDDIRRSTAIDRTTSNYNDAKEKVQKIRDLVSMGKYDADLVKYIPGLADMAIQGMLDDIDTKEKVANPSYKDKEELDFQILLNDNYYVNPSNIHICFPIKLKKKSSATANIDGDMIPVNNFFAHWVKEVSITKYGSDKELPPTFSPWEVFQYSDAMLKHLPKDSLKPLQKALIYSKKPIYCHNTSYERRVHNGTAPTGTTALSTTAAKANAAKDLNIDDRITLFSHQLEDEYVYRVPLRYFSDIDKINFPTKIDYRIKLFLETNMNKLFESRDVLASSAKIPDADAQIIFTRAPFVQYEQILLDKNFRQYLETIMVSKKIIRMGAQKTSIQKSYKIKKGSDSLNIEFLGANRQFDWIEISIVNDKSDKHTTIYDSYNQELAAQNTKTLKLSNFTEIYSLTNEKKYSIDNLTEKHLLYKQFVVWHCNCSSVAPMIDYTDNPIYRKLLNEEGYCSIKNDERVYLDLRASSGYVKEAEKLERNDSKINLEITLKAAAKFNLRVRVWAYSLSEYLYVLSKNGLTLKHRTYAINQSDDDFLE